MTVGSQFNHASQSAVVWVIPLQECSTATSVSATTSSEMVGNSHQKTLNAAQAVLVPLVKSVSNLQNTEIRETNCGKAEVVRETQYTQTTPNSPRIRYRPRREQISREAGSTWVVSAMMPLFEHSRIRLS